MVTRTQLFEAGLTPKQVERQVTARTLIPVHRGVYRVGHAAPSVLATYMAAVLACGPEALLAGRAAAHLYQLLRTKQPPPPEVISPTQRNVPGVLTKRCRRLDLRDGTRHKQIPVTTVARTVADLAGAVTEHQLTVAAHEASIRYDLVPDDVPATGFRGAKALRKVLHGDTQLTLSKLERHFLSLLKENSLPSPETNRLAGGRRVDCRWPHHRLTVELDGYRYHRSRHAWEQERSREREAYARGDDFRRYTYGDVLERPRMVVRELCTLLKRS